MSMARYVFTVSAYKGKRGYGMAGISGRITEGRQLAQKNKAVIKGFLGTSRMTSETAVLPAYYGELLAWALKRHLEREYWQVVRVLGYRYSEPVYLNTNTDYHKNEELLLDGQLLIDNGNHRLVITVDAKAFSRSLVRVEGSTSKKREIKEFVGGIRSIVEKKNYYRNKKFAFNGRIQFMDTCDELWGNINLSPLMKAEIKASTVDLLKSKQAWTEHGMPLKRCVLLAGGADKDKAAICKALITEAVGITCIITNACDLDYDCAAQLYHLARDLSPCIVFIEDIDCIGQNRIKFGYHKGTALISLLTMLANVEEHEEIVTVATASCEGALVKAMLF